MMVITMVIWSELRIIGRFRDDVNGGDAPHFSLKSSGGARGNLK